MRLRVQGTMQSFQPLNREPLNPEPVSLYALSNRLKCMEYVPRPCVAERSAVE